ncbi:type II secretion system GspH family protein [Candidatus Gracilibacteria bacterium]|nr:type II secretion system GspH family protein [Candidatus Gracilibacteria bacterium]
MKKGYKAFTLVELIVVITILAILGTIGFISLQGYGISARDSKRLSDLSIINRGLEYYYLTEDRYPDAHGGIEISFSGSQLWVQGTFNDSLVADVRRIPQKPVDPLTGDEYLYAVIHNKQEYQIGATFEGFRSISFLPETYANFAGVRIQGNYNGGIIGRIIGSDRYIFAVPSLITSENTDIDILDIISNRSFLRNNSSALPFGRLPQGGTPIPNEFSSNNPQEAILFSANQDTITSEDLDEITQRLYDLYLSSDFLNSPFVRNILDNGGPSEQRIERTLNLLSSSSSTRQFINPSISYLDNTSSTIIDTFSIENSIIPWDSTQTRVISDYLTFVGTFEGFEWNTPIEFTTGGQGNPTAELGGASLRGSSGTFTDGTNLEMDIPPLGETYTSYLYVDGVTLSFTVSRENDPNSSDPGDSGEPDLPPSNHVVSETMPYYWGATYEFPYISFVGTFPGQGFNWGSPIEFETSGDGNPQIQFNGSWLSSGTFNDGTQMRVDIPDPGETRTVYLIIDDFIVEYNVTRPANP